MAGRKPTPAAERFREKCKPVENGCIEWTGGATQNGYGLFYFAPRMRTAHRWAYEQAHGEQRVGVDVCHHCDNRLCVNLAHLFAGTRRDNMRDAAAKGRTRKTPTVFGETHPGAVLKTEEVLSIREWHRAGWPMRLLSDSFGVSFAHVSRIVNRQSWRHV